MEKKAIPIGIENFEDIIKDNYYYVDKSMLIEDILVNRAAVTLFTRPRRFGKTLNMSMIKYFFDVRNKDENRKLFEGFKGRYLGNVSFGNKKIDFKNLS